MQNKIPSGSYSALVQFFLTFTLQARKSVLPTTTIRPKGQKKSKCFFKPTFPPINDQTNSTLLLWNLRPTFFRSFLKRNWRNQKDISKLTDLFGRIGKIYFDKFSRCMKQPVTGASYFEWALFELWNSDALNSYFYRPVIFLLCQVCQRPTTRSPYGDQAHIPGLQGLTPSWKPLNPGWEMYLVEARDHRPGSPPTAYGAPLLANCSPF